MEVDGSIRLFDQPYRLDVQRSCADERLGAGCTESSTAECNTRRGFCRTSTVWMPGSVCVEEVEVVRVQRGERIIPVVCEDVKQRLREKGVTTFVTIPHSP
jgi:hypothetical protein